MAKTTMIMSENKRFDAEHDLRTISEAERIQKDAGRMRRVNAVFGEQKKALEEMGKMMGKMLKGKK